MAMLVSNIYYHKMYKPLIFILILLATCCELSARNIAERQLLNKDPVSNGFSTHLAFELTTPTGSCGRWTTGGGATLTLSYTHRFDERWFFSPGIGAFYNSMGTDFIPQYDHVSEGTVKNWGARFPILSGCLFKLSDDLKLAIATGPLLNINIIAKEQASPSIESESIDADESINLFGKGFHRADLQWEFLVGLTYKHHYCVGLSAGAGLTNVASMTQGQRTLNIRRNNLAIILSYTF